MVHMFADYSSIILYNFLQDMLPHGQAENQMAAYFVLFMECSIYVIVL